jgi:hypothetical protein
MFTVTTTSAGCLVTAIVLLTGAAILRAGAAAADANQDSQFLALLSQQDIPAVSGVPDLIKSAHKVCSELDGGASVNTVVDELVDYANTVTPGADPGRLRRTETRFLMASVGAYCPNHQVSFSNRGETPGRVRLTSFREGANPTNPIPPMPELPSAHTLKPPQAPAPTPPKKAPPVVGPPPGGGGGGGGTGGGTGGAGPTPPSGPGIITLAP